MFIANMWKQLQLERVELGDVVTGQLLSLTSLQAKQA